MTTITFSVCNKIGGPSLKPQEIGNAIYEENLNAFIEANKILKKETTIVSKDDSTALLRVRNNYNNVQEIKFDYVGNRVLSVKTVSQSRPRKGAKMNSVFNIESTFNEYTYTEDGKLASVIRPHSEYKIEYNELGYVDKKFVNESAIEKNVYVSELPTKKEFANGDIAEKSFNEDGKIISRLENNAAVALYDYTSKGKVSSYTDLKTGTVFSYDYDDQDRAIKCVSSDGFEIEYEYSNESIDKRIYKFENKSIETVLGDRGISTGGEEVNETKDISDRPIETTYSNGYYERRNYVIPEPTYDELKEATYEETLENRTNDLKFSRFENNYGVFEYQYDECDNIVSVTGPRDNSYYTYDCYGQLISSMNKGMEIGYQYDTNGNIVRKGATNFYYDFSTGFDLLTRVDNADISYDEIGNMTSYNNNTYSWFGNKLIGVNNDTKYTYNASGIRTSKTVNGLTTKYYLEGHKVVWEQNPTNTIYYLYSRNNVIGLNYNGQMFYYMKNALNDIIGIFDELGNVVVEYEYDPWGSITSITGCLANTLGIDNPYRYRSYRFDNETGFYYLQSRYYSPELSRFISPDDLSNLEYTILSEDYSKNLYAYSSNNPVNFSDPHGNMSTSILNFIKALYADLKLVPDRYVSTPVLVFNAANLYLGFHETAQLVAAKDLTTKGYATQLEYRTSNGEADILAFKGVNYLYEVKPFNSSVSETSRQLQKYINATGFAKGPAVINKEIDFLPKITMKVYSEGKGIVRYAFYKDQWRWFNKYVKVEVTAANLRSKILIGFWVGVAIATAILVFTIVEDCVTYGAGVADDAASVGVAAGGFRGAVALGLAFC